MSAVSVLRACHIAAAVRAVVTVLICLAVALPAHADGEPSVVSGHDLTAAGDNIVHATGDAGLRLSVPTESPLTVDDIDVTLHTATYAFISLAKPCDLPASPGRPGLCTFFDVYRVPELQPAWDTYVNGSRILPVGDYELYLLTDGSVTLRLRLRALGGSQEVTATGAVAGALERLPTRCPEFAEPCTNIAYGGATRTMQGPGRVVAIGLARIPFWLPEPASLVANKGSTAVDACIYPDRFDQTPRSSNPEDYPQGCEMLGDGNAVTGEGIDRFIHVVTGGFDGTNALRGSIVINAVADGDAYYTGYVGRQVSAVPGGSVVGYGIWISYGLDCGAAGCFQPALESGVT